MSKNSKHILSVTLERSFDGDPDTTSYLGEFSDSADSAYAIDCKHSLDCQINTKANDAELDECDCTGGDAGRVHRRYFNAPVDNYQGESDTEIRKYVLQDYTRFQGFVRGDWHYVGITARASVIALSESTTTNRLYPGGAQQTISSGGLWAVESDSDAAYFAHIEKEELADLRGQLRAIGFSQRAISAAYKNVERKEG